MLSGLECCGVVVRVHVRKSSYFLIIKMEMFAGSKAVCGVSKLDKKFS